MVVSLLGLALRGRKVTLGREASRREARKGRLRALLLATDAGPSAARDSGAGPGVLLLDAGMDKQSLGALAGRGELAALGITDIHLAAGLAKQAREWRGPR